MAFLYRRSGDLAFRGLIRKIYYMQKSPVVLSWERGGEKDITCKSHLQSSAGKEEGEKGAGDGERNEGFYLIKTFQREAFVIKLVPLHHSSRFKRFSPMWCFSRPLNTRNSADAGSRRKIFPAESWEGRQ